MRFLSLNPRFVGRVFRPNDMLEKNDRERLNPRFVGRVFRLTQKNALSTLNVVLIPDLWGESSDYSV